MTNRFDLLEERLQQLEDVALSNPEPPKVEVGIRQDGNDASAVVAGNNRPESFGASDAQRDLNKHAAGAIPVLPGDRSAHPSERTSVACRMVNIGDLSGSSDSSPEPNSIAWEAKLDVLRGGILLDCREKTAALVQEAVEDAGRQLKGLAGEMLRCFLADAERALQRSSGVIASQAIQLLDQEMRIAVRHIVSAAFADMTSSTVDSWAEIGLPGFGKQVAPEQGRGQNARERNGEQEFAAAAEAIRNNSSALLTSLDARLQETLQAFQETTATQLAANLQTTVRELLEREIEALRKPRESLDNDRRGADPGVTPWSLESSLVRSAVQCAAKPSAPLDASLADSGAWKYNGQGSGYLGCDNVQEPQKLPKKRLAWHILGLEIDWNR